MLLIHNVSHIFKVLKLQLAILLLSGDKETDVIWSKCHD